MADCPTCGLPYTEGAKFCPACGGKLPVKIKPRVCRTCGNTLSENAKFCNICGTPALQEEKKEQVKEQPVDEDRNPTMDEIQVPIINDDIPGLQEKPLKDENTPTMDSIYMPGQQPAVQPVAAAAVQSVPTPAPSVSPVQLTKPAYENPVINSGAVPTPAAPQSNPYSGGMAGGTYQNTVQPNNSFDTQSRVITPEGVSVQPNVIPNTIPNNIPNNMPQMNNVTPGKGVRTLVNIILVLLIIAVVLFDVFFLFKDKIFGSDDSKDAKSSAVIVTVGDIGASESGIDII